MYSDDLAISQDQKKLAKLPELIPLSPRSVKNNNDNNQQILSTMKRLLGLAAVTAAMIALPLLSYAAEKPAETPGKAEKKAKALPFNGKVGAVDKNAKTVTLEGKEKSRVFQITSETKIHKEKKPATLDDVMVGDHVGGSYRENAEGKMEVVTLNTGLPQTKSKTKEKETK